MVLKEQISCVPKPVRMQSTVNNVENSVSEMGTKLDQLLSLMSSENGERKTTK